VQKGDEEGSTREKKWYVNVTRRKRSSCHNLHTWVTAVFSETWLYLADHSSLTFNTYFITVRGNRSWRNSQLHCVFFISLTLVLPILKCEVVVKREVKKKRDEENETLQVESKPLHLNDARKRNPPLDGTVSTRRQSKHASDIERPAQQTVVLMPFSPHATVEKYWPFSVLMVVGNHCVECSLLCPTDKVKFSFAAVLRKRTRKARGPKFERLSVQPNVCHPCFVIRWGEGGLNVQI
jgi:hypothetical protein